MQHVAWYMFKNLDDNASTTGAKNTLLQKYTE